MVNTSPAEERGRDTAIYVLRHLRFGWRSLLVFVVLGLALEAMHGLKVRWYLDVSNESRRLMWTLAHTHGTLLALVHVGFAMTVGTLPEASTRWRRLASPCLVGASVLVPGGFFLGGIFLYDGDPGWGVLMVPLGAALLFLAAFLTARGASTRDRET